MFQWFCAPSACHLQQPESAKTVSHRLAFEQGVSHSMINYLSSKSQVFSTWCEQVRSRLCQTIMKFGS